MNRRTPKLLWPIATAVSLLAAATFGSLWAVGGNREIVERVVYVPAKSVPIAFDVPVSEPSPPSPWENRRLCQLVLEKGVDAMPQSTAHSHSRSRTIDRDDTNRGLLHELLNDPTS